MCLVTHASTNLLDRIISISIYKTSYYHLASITNYLELYCFSLNKYACKMQNPTNRTRDLSIGLTIHL